MTADTTPSDGYHYMRIENVKLSNMIYEALAPLVHVEEGAACQLVKSTNRPTNQPTSQPTKLPIE